jgi:hypothetical protein
MEGWGMRLVLVVVKGYDKIILSGKSMDEGLV